MTLFRAFLISVLLACAAGWSPALAEPQPPATRAELDAWSAAKLMGTGVNIGNTLENTATWETGWGNPPITKAFVDRLAELGFKTVRVPVAWDTYARDGRIDRAKLERVGQVVDWVTAAGMFCVINIHWDRGWIDSGNKARFGKAFHTFSPEADRKFRSYWTQIATYFADRDQRVIFEGLNEETNFEGAGSEAEAYTTLGRVNQAFIDTVRNTGGNNRKRLLIIAGYTTDIDKTATNQFVLPHDAVPDKLLLSIHYYTPWSFAGLTRDENGQKVQMTWGTAEDVAELRRKFGKLEDYSARKNIPVFLGEFGAAKSKDPASRVKWMTAVALTARSRGMVPVLWDTGQDLSRKPPFAISPELSLVLKEVQKLDEASAGQ